MEQGVCHPETSTRITIRAFLTTAIVGEFRYRAYSVIVWNTRAEYLELTLFMKKTLN